MGSPVDTQQEGLGFNPKLERVFSVSSLNIYFDIKWIFIHRAETFSQINYPLGTEELGCTRRLFFSVYK